jgi:CRISPR/Cas system-associated endonuclease Cas3-HD
MTTLRTRLEAAGKRGAEEVAARLTSDHGAKTMMAIREESALASSALVLPLMLKLADALSIANQFNNNLRARTALKEPAYTESSIAKTMMEEALRELEDYLLKGEGKNV